MKPPSPLNSDEAIMSSIRSITKRSSALVDDTWRDCMGYESAVLINEELNQHQANKRATRIMKSALAFYLKQSRNRTQKAYSESNKGKLNRRK